MGLNLNEVLGAYTSTPSELSTPELIMLYGRPGSGKTHIAAGALEVPGFKKGLYIDTEGSSVGVVRDPRWEILRVDKYPDEKRAKALTEARGTDIDPEEERFRFLSTILSDGPQGLFNPSNTHDYDVIVLDTFDVAQDWAIRYFLEGAGRKISKSGEADTFRGWDSVKKWSNDTAYHLKRTTPLGIIVVHDREEKAQNGAMTKMLRLSGAAKDTLPSIPDIVVYLDRRVEEEEYSTYGYFGTADGKVTKDRFNFPPVVKNITIQQMYKYIQKQGETK